jgi:hypothetical protein
MVGRERTSKLSAASIPWPDNVRPCTGTPTAMGFLDDCTKAISDEVKMGSVVRVPEIDASYIKGPATPTHLRTSQPATLKHEASSTRSGSAHCPLPFLGRFTTTFTDEQDVHTQGHRRLHSKSVGLRALPRHQFVRV